MHDEAYMSPAPDEVAAGHAFYTKRTLAFYDAMILGFFSRTAWRCPAQRMLEHYDAHISDNHLDIGVGTGYFLERCHFPSPSPRLALMDLNTDCLDVAAQRVERYHPETYVANVLTPIAIEVTPFDSVGMNYLLHCLPGTIASKAVAFDNIKKVANPGATIFGATLLTGGVRRNWFARRVMKRNNAHGIFSNAHDDLDGLHAALEHNFDTHEVQLVGCVAIFAAQA